MASAALFYSTLDVGVTLAIAGIAQQGAPSARDIDEAREVSGALGAQGDQLLYGGPACAELMTRLIAALAVLAFCPGGVRLGPCHWEEEAR